MIKTTHRTHFILMPLLVNLSLVPSLQGDPPSGPAGGAWSFSEQSAGVGLAYTHYYDDSVFNGEYHSIAGGLAIGDINGDGWDDIYAVTGYTDEMGVNTNPNKLFISQQNGTYLESASAWELDPNDRHSAGPLIADFNGDGLNDLAVGGVDGDFFSLYLNDGDSTFTDTTASSGAPSNSWNFSMAAGDIDRDNDLDLFQARWLNANDILLLQNNGNAQFTDITAAIMTGDKPVAIFSPAFADLNGDGWDDLVLTSDFRNSTNGGSTYFLHNTSQLVKQTPVVLTDENGMGGAIADYDNDGDLDWFVSSIYDTDQTSEANWGVSGNRLYRNDGSGVFTDVTDTAEVRVGYWGWGACFADFNNDMHLDLYHVNGFPAGALTSGAEDEFDNDPARMFISDGDNTFTEQAAALGVADTGQGRAILCFDNDRDGDIDILINNSRGDSRFFQNDLDNANHYLEIKLVQAAPNADAIGAKVYVTAGGVRQMRHVQAGGSVFSSHPTAQHFGLAANTTASLVEITWPDGSMHQLTGQAADQYLVLNKEDLESLVTIHKDGFE